LLRENEKLKNEIKNLKEENKKLKEQVEELKKDSIKNNPDNQSKDADDSIFTGIDFFNKTGFVLSGYLDDYFKNFHNVVFWLSEAIARFRLSNTIGPMDIKISVFLLLEAVRSFRIVKKKIYKENI